jgi:hypothetical protein
MTDFKGCTAGSLGDSYKKEHGNATSHATCHPKGPGGVSIKPKRVIVTLSYLMEFALQDLGLI